MNKIITYNEPIIQFDDEGHRIHDLIEEFSIIVEESELEENLKIIRSPERGITNIVVTDEKEV